MHTIKRYANRKLYDATDKRYVTLDRIAEMIKAGEEISVVDNRTGEDLTASTVSQILARDSKGDAHEAASGVMVQLLRKGPGAIVDYGKRYVSLWDRALTMADEEIDKLVDRLVKDKEITRSEGSRLKKDISGRADDLKKWIGEKIDQRMNDALDVMHLASREQVVRLTEKIDSLTKKVQTLEKRLARRAKAEKDREAERLRKDEEKRAAEGLKKEEKARAAEAIADRESDQEKGDL
jgi:polyhydroxyalkanoate synthesis repressor PhaR